MLISHLHASINMWKFMNIQVILVQRLPRVMTIRSYDSDEKVTLRRILTSMSFAGL